ncbi:MAG: hypothetical protein AB7N99_00875 [Simkaniaceae bacterium]
MSGLTPIVRGGGGDYSLPGSDLEKRERPEGYSHPPSTGPDLLTFLWQGLQALIGKEPSLEKERERFAEKWGSLGFMEKLEEILRFKEVNLLDCQTATAVEFFTPFLDSPEIEVVLARVGIDSTTLLGAIHQPDEFQSKVILGKYRDHLDTYLIHVTNGALKIVARSDVSPYRKVVEFLRIAQTVPQAEDGSFTVMEGVRRCYAALPEGDRKIWREVYRAQGTVGDDAMVDYAITHSMEHYFYMHILRPLLESQGEDPQAPEKDLAFLQALQEAQARSQGRVAESIMGSMRQLRGGLLESIAQTEKELYPSLAVPSKGSFILDNPLSEVAKQATDHLVGRV